MTLERVKITLLRVKITLERVKITFCLQNLHSCLLKPHSGVCSEKIDTHACEFYTQTYHFHTFAYQTCSSHMCSYKNPKWNKLLYNRAAYLNFFQYFLGFFYDSINHDHYRSESFISFKLVY
jgi:hypothetical protein